MLLRDDSCHAQGSNGYQQAHTSSRRRENGGGAMHGTEDAIHADEESGTVKCNLGDAWRRIASSRDLSPHQR